MSQKGTLRHLKIRETRGPWQVSLGSLNLMGVVLMLLELRTGRNLATRTMRPQRCMGNDEQCPQVQRKGQSHILVACRSLVITNTIFNEARGTIICGGLRSINAHAEQERSESTELDTVRVSRNPTTVETADGEVQTNEEATVYVHDLELFVTVQILEHTPAILSPGKLCEDHGYSYEWACGQKKHILPKMAETSNATPKTTHQSLSQDHQPVLPVRVPVRALNRYRRTRLMLLRQVQQ